MFANSEDIGILINIIFEIGNYFRKCFGGPGKQLTYPGQPPVFPLCPFRELNFSLAYRHSPRLHTKVHRMD